MTGDWTGDCQLNRPDESSKNTARLVIYSRYTYVTLKDILDVFFSSCPTFLVSEIDMATPVSTPSGGSLKSLSPPTTPGAVTLPNLYQNSTDPDAPWLVQKFGGTSVGKFAVKIAQDAVA